MTETKKIEEQMRETTETLKALIQASPVAIAVLDVDGMIRIWNPAAERIFGWSEWEVIGHPFPTVEEETREGQKRLFDVGLQSEGFVGLELPRKKRDGTVIDVNLSAAPLHDASGAATGLMVLISDISDRKKAGEALKLSERRFRLLAENAQDLIFRYRILP